MLFGSCVSTCPNLVTIQERKHLTMFSKIASVLAWRPCMSAQLSTPKELGEWGASFRWQPQALTPNNFYTKHPLQKPLQKTVLHQTPLTRSSFYTKYLLAFWTKIPNKLCTKQNLLEKSVHRKFLKKLL